MTSIEWEIIKSKLVPVTVREGKRICPEKAVLYFNAELKRLREFHFEIKKYIYICCKQNVDDHEILYAVFYCVGEKQFQNDIIVLDTLSWKETYILKY